MCADRRGGSGAGASDRSGAVGHSLFRAVALVREGHQLVGNGWEPRFIEVTMTRRYTWADADADVREFVATAGPRGVQWNGAFVRED